MKIKTVVTEFTHDDLVNLLSTAAYGSDWLSFSVPFMSGREIEKVKGETREDYMARILLAGLPIFFNDYYAEDENDFYGDIRHFWGGHMTYEVTLEDIKRGVARAMDNGGYILSYVSHWADLECADFDLTEAEAIMQWIVFGEEVYC